MQRRHDLGRNNAAPDRCPNGTPYVSLRKLQSDADVYVIQKIGSFSHARPSDPGRAGGGALSPQVIVSTSCLVWNYVGVRYLVILFYRRPLRAIYARGKAAMSRSPGSMAAPMRGMVLPAAALAHGVVRPAI